MANFLKNTWWIILLILAGGIILFLSLHPSKPEGDQGVVLNDIFPPPQSQPEAQALPAVPVKKVNPVPPMAIVTSPIAGQRTGFTIQVYSFQDKNRAETALQALKSNGYEAFLIMSDLGTKGVWYRVRVGGIMDEASARKMLDEIRKNYNSGFILKTKQ